jgi:enoyl-CoA hydratase/carnithine racemase
MTRRNGILELCFHSDGVSLKWDSVVHEELGYCFQDVANDPDNKIVIITGAGDTFCTELNLSAFNLGERTWHAIHQEGRRLLDNLLNIDVPVIGAVNGPAHIHAELALLSNIVVAAQEATFQDCVHYTAGWVPGDGVHVVWPALLGPTRAGYFLMTGEVIPAQKAMELGFVNEVVPRADVLSRAWALAEQLAEKPTLVRRYTRLLLSQEMKRRLLNDLSHGIALEGLPFLDNAPT